MGNRINLRRIECPRCGADVRIPLWWALGVEGIFRCKTCRQPFKTGYKTGAFLSGLSLAVSLAQIQALVWIFSIHSMVFFAALAVPAWLTLAFLLRRLWMVRKTKHAVRNALPEEIPADWELMTPEERYRSLSRLPRDTRFGEETASEKGNETECL